MLGSGPSSDQPRQIWFVAAMAVLLVALVGSIALGYAPSPRKRRQPRATLTEPSAHPLTPGPPNHLAEGNVTPESVLTRQLDSGLTLSPSSTTIPAATPTESPTPVGIDHYWLQRPIGPDGNDQVDRFYPYGSRGDGSYPIHHGVEFVNPMGTPIRAVADGTIVVAGEDRTEVHGARAGFYGQVIVEKLERTYAGRSVYIVYGHLSQVTAKLGQSVSAGDTIGLVGMSGVALGPHVHVEVRYAENDYLHTVNPELWFTPDDGYGTLAGQLLGSEGDPLAEVKVRLYRASAPDRLVREFTTYPSRFVNGDPAWQENFAQGALSAGDWTLQLYHRQQAYSRAVTIVPGETTMLRLQLP